MLQWLFAYKFCHLFYFMLCMLFKLQEIVMRYTHVHCIHLVIVHVACANLKINNMSIHEKYEAKSMTKL